jgi:hypothetical protein
LFLEGISGIDRLVAFHPQRLNLKPTPLPAVGSALPEKNGDFRVNWPGGMSNDVG